MRDMAERDVQDSQRGAKREWEAQFYMLSTSVELHMVPSLGNTV
jgi:hypothetical protein